MAGAVLPSGGPSSLMSSSLPPAARPDVVRFEPDISANYKPPGSQAGLQPDVPLNPDLTGGYNFVLNKSTYITMTRQQCNIVPSERSSSRRRLRVMAMLEHASTVAASDAPARASADSCLRRAH